MFPMVFEHARRVEDSKTLLNSYNIAEVGGRRKRAGRRWQGCLWGEGRAGRLAFVLPQNVSHTNFNPSTDCSVSP